MTTLNKALEAFDEMGKTAADPMWANHVELPKAVLRRWIKAFRLALSSLPAQAVGVKKPLTSAWLAYWPGAGSIDSVTRVTRSEHEAKRWRDDGAEVTELVERSSPSQPAAVGVTDQFRQLRGAIERITQEISVTAREQRDGNTPDEFSKGWDAALDQVESLVRNHSPHGLEAHRLVDALEAALRSTP